LLLSVEQLTDIASSAKAIKPAAKIFIDPERPAPAILRNGRLPYVFIIGSFLI
jgi:hypothetical protein